MPSSKVNIQSTFLVGSVRSGTTLLQSLLAAHPQVVSFPESHFFWGLTSDRNRWQRRLNIAGPNADSHFYEFLSKIGRTDLKEKLSGRMVFIPQYINAFVRILSIIAQEQNKPIWLEKTPIHLHYIDIIEQYIQPAKFIHIVRNGPDVVASTYEVTHKHPNVWGGSRSIDTCIDRWISDFKITARYINESNHRVVLYENLVTNPRRELTQLCKFMDIHYDGEMLSRYGDSAKVVSLASEPWKQSVSQSIRNTGSKKFEAIFDLQQQQYIIKRLAETDASQLTTNEKVLNRDHG